MAQKIYALLVGINDYQGNVKKLTGCINDVDHFHTYLKSNFKDNLYDVVLKDGEATRTNIIKQFREHLCRATTEDVVVFHYSGHGACWKSAREFSEKGFSGEWNEGLVCYDSRVGDYDLADKELAVLLYEVAKNDPHIAVIFDSCHSGSGTRDADTFNGMEPRATYEMKDERPLDSYLEGYYAKLHRQGELGVPTGKHVLLAACEKKQTAKEDKQIKRGVFSSTLQEVLDKFGGDITYADLFMRCRAFVLKRADEQTPQFEYFEGFNTWTGFLGRKATYSARRYKVQCKTVDKKNRWEIEAGAIQGFPTDAKKRVELVLYHEDDQSRVAGEASTTWVGLQKSGLELRFPSPENAGYRAELASLSVPPIPVYFEGDEPGKEILQKILKDNQAIGADLIDFPAGTRYTLLAKDGQFILKQRDLDLIIQGVKGILSRERGERDLALPQYSEESAQVMLSKLKHVATWERCLALENPHTKFDPTKIDFTFYEGKEEYPHQGKNDITLYYVKVEDKYKPIRGMLKARNNTQHSLWFALLQFSRKYGIKPKSNIEIEPNKEAVIWGDDPKDNAFGLPKEVNESIDTFKLIVSTEKVDDFLLEQADLELGKIISSDADRDTGGEDDEEEQEKIQEDWFTKTIRIKTVRQIDRVNDNKDVALAQGQIVIKKHPAVKANLSLRAAKAPDRGVGQDFDFYKAYERHGIEMLDFAPPQRGDEAKKNVENILELTDIQDDEDLEKNPLEIDVNLNLAENEYILPVATDGEHVFLCGDPEKDDNGNTHISISHIPEGVSDNRREVVKALKLYFIKTYLKRENVNQLCWVEFKADGAIKRQNSNLANKVAAAQNILLLIHGIIGDTEVMAKGLHVAGLEQKFDLVLTYDYENLSTPIEETAEKLKQQLAAYGLGENDNKKLTLLVHSMGGLVARCFIEQKGGNKVVDHLVMCGTPNNGSPFGKIETARKLMNILTPLALTYVPVVVPFAGALLFRLKKVTPTLAQMDPKSPFIEALNSSGDPRVHYTILAGDINEYKEPAESSFLRKLLAKVEKGFVFDLLFGMQAHDIAVSVDSILGVDGGRNPAPVKKNVACHHMNYFISAAGQKELQKVEW